MQENDRKRGWTPEINFLTLSPEADTASDDSSSSPERCHFLVRKWTVCCFVYAPWQLECFRCHATQIVCLGSLSRLTFSQAEQGVLWGSQAMANNQDSPGIVPAHRAVKSLCHFFYLVFCSVFSSFLPPPSLNFSSFLISCFLNSTKLTSQN